MVFISFVLTKKIVVSEKNQTLRWIYRQGRHRHGSSAVVQPTGDALVAVEVESIEVDSGTTVHTEVNLGTGQNRITCSAHNARSRSGVCIDEVATSISLIIRALGVAITNRRLDRSKRRYRTTVALKPDLPFLVGCLNRCLCLRSLHRALPKVSS